MLRLALMCALAAVAIAAPTWTSQLDRAVDPKARLPMLTGGSTTCTAQQPNKVPTSVADCNGSCADKYVRRARFVGKSQGCQERCQQDPNMLAYGTTSDCWCYTSDLTNSIYGSATKYDGAPSIGGWAHTSTGFQGYTCGGGGASDTYSRAEIGDDNALQNYYFGQTGQWAGVTASSSLTFSVDPNTDAAWVSQPNNCIHGNARDCGSPPGTPAGGGTRVEYYYDTLAQAIAACNTLPYAKCSAILHHGGKANAQWNPRCRNVDSPCATNVANARTYFRPPTGLSFNPTTPYPTMLPTTLPPTEHPTPNPTASPTENPTTRPPSPSPSHTPTETPTPSPTPSPTEHPTTLPPTLLPTTLPPTIAPTAIVHNCHCSGCESHYKTNEHIEKSPTLCGDFCEQEGDKCQFSLFDSVTTKCYLYDQSQVSRIKIVPTGASKYTCYTKYHLTHGVAGAAQV